MNQKTPLCAVTQQSAMLLCDRKLRLAICVWLFFAADLFPMFGEPEDSAPSIRAEARQMIDNSAQHMRTFPAYIATSYEVHGNRVIKKKRYVRNDPDHLHLVRLEETTSTDENVNEEIVYISNRQAFWELRNGNAQKIANIPSLQPVIMLRLDTAYLLGISDSTEYKIAKNIDYFGTPCTRITVSLSKTLLKKLEDAGAPKSTRVNAGKPAVTQPRGNSLPDEGRIPAILTTHAYPAIFIYIIDEKLSFIRSWQSLSPSGQMLDDVSFQEFSAPANLPDSLFAIPLDYHISSE